MAWSTMDRGAVQVLASMLLSVVAAMVWRRPLSHPLPWLTVLIAAVSNELASGMVDGIYEAEEIALSERDVLLVMIVPTILFLLSRFLPQVMSGRRVDCQFIVPISRQARRQQVIEAEFQEIRKVDFVGQAP